jgi:glutamate/tyrosine decarboxylase-like PLP-dependent enzyme
MKSRANPKRNRTSAHRRGNKKKSPRGTSAPDLLSLVASGLEGLDRWKSRWATFEDDATLDISPQKMENVLRALVDRLNDNYPFYHPSYAGQMLKPPHPIASIAYFLTQQINPNNHALDGGPATAKMEFEVIDELATMLGFENHLGHLTSSGTIANLEALWVARKIHPGKAIAFSSEAHYTHRRMCDVLGARAVEIDADSCGRMDLEDLRKKLETQNIGTVVATAGTTGLGAVDPIDKLTGLQRQFGFRVHVDAAYGGFFCLLADLPNLLGDSTRRAFKAIRNADSVVVDPHKHGLQPYGCGSVIFRDPTIGTLYKHDSPYTYFTSKELHLGEISLECSRAGASAAALWATLKCFPLSARTGLGAVLTKTRKAAVEFAGLAEEGSVFRVVTNPELDIVAYFAANGTKKVSAISRTSDRIFESAMHRKSDPIYLAKMTLKKNFLSHHVDLEWDQPTMTVLRSVLMKPEHRVFVPQLYDHLKALVNE